MSVITIGKRAEDLASQYLIKMGYTIVSRNIIKYGIGEIDILCTDINCSYIVVEVKSRKYLDSKKLTPSQTISQKKITKIINTFYAYLIDEASVDNDNIDKLYVQFDIIEVIYTNQYENYELNHYKNIELN